MSDGKVNGAKIPDAAPEIERAQAMVNYPIRRMVGYGFTPKNDFLQLVFATDKENFAVSLPVDGIGDLITSLLKVRTSMMKKGMNVGTGLDLKVLPDFEQRSLLRGPTVLHDPKPKLILPGR